jgi:HK97 gp10 family phage protein
VKVTMKVEGLSDLVEALEDLKKATATNVKKRALIDAAEPLRADAERYAPRQTGRLASTIAVSTKLSRSQSGEKESKVEVYIGPASMTRAIVQEFGSIYQSPRPYMRPAWDKNKKDIPSAVGASLWEEIAKAAARAARKAARLLAKQSAT